jgi:hypothetical protein
VRIGSLRLASHQRLAEQRVRCGLGAVIRRGAASLDSALWFVVTHCPDRTLTVPTPSCTAARQTGLSLQLKNPRLPELTRGGLGGHHNAGAFSLRIIVDEGISEGGPSA